jgi:hypothetical protein
LDQLQFCIRLWSAPNNATILEFQRTRGCSFLAQQAFKCIVRAAKQEQAPPNRSALPLPTCLPKSTPEQAAACTAEALGIAAGLLQDHRIDAQMMALESLAKLTACETAQVLAARTVLTPTGDFLPTLLSLIMTAATSSESATTEQDHAPLMRRQALLILTNCLQVSKLQNPPSDSFLVAILDTINACVDQPHDACLAVQCLRALHECPRRLNKLGAKQSLHVAHAQGSRRHVRLQGETAKLQLQMSNLM